MHKNLHEKVGNAKGPYYDVKDLRQVLKTELHASSLSPYVPKNQSSSIARGYHPSISVAPTLRDVPKSTPYAPSSQLLPLSLDEDYQAVGFVNPSRYVNLYPTVQTVKASEAMKISTGHDFPMPKGQTVAAVVLPTKPALLTKADIHSSTTSASSVIPLSPTTPSTGNLNLPPAIAVFSASPDAALIIKTFFKRVPFMNFYKPLVTQFRSRMSYSTTDLDVKRLDNTVPLLMSAPAAALWEYAGWHDYISYYLSTQRDRYVNSPELPDHDSLFKYLATEEHDYPRPKAPRVDANIHWLRTYGSAAPTKVEVSNSKTQSEAYEILPSTDHKILTVSHAIYICMIDKVVIPFEVTELPTMAVIAAFCGFYSSQHPDFKILAIEPQNEGMQLFYGTSPSFKTANVISTSAYFNAILSPETFVFVDTFSVYLPHSSCLKFLFFLTLGDLR